MDSVESLIADVAQGKMIVLMDDEDRENEGDLVMAASLVRPEDINFMATHARGLICLTLTSERCQQLDLHLMVQKNEAAYSTNFTCSIEAAKGVTTGISAADRAKTVLTAVAAHAKPEDLVQPGHIFPLKARQGGVLNRAGHTEAACDLARMAGMEAAGVIVEIMNPDGTMARRTDLERFSLQHGLKMGTIADLIHYRMTHESTIAFQGEHVLDTQYGQFQVFAFQDLVNPELTHMAFVNGDISQETAPFVRVHVCHPLRDWIGGIRSGQPSWSLPKAMEWVGQKKGVVVLLDQAYKASSAYQDVLNEAKMHTDQSHDDDPDVKMSQINYPTIGTGSQILRYLKVTKMRLLSTKLKFNALSGFGLEITEYIEPS